MTARQRPTTQGTPLELTRHRAASYARLAVADAGLAFSFVSIVAGVLGLADDAGDALVLVSAGLVAGAGGAVARRSLIRRHRPSPGRILSGLALAWIMLVGAGASIYVLTGTITRLDDAVVESAAGFSTTAVTTVDPGALNVPMQLFRAATQWVGGLLGLVIGVVTLPLVLRGALPGGNRDRHAAEQIAPTAIVGRRRILAIYAATTGVLAVGFRVVGLGTLDSIVHALTTASTGGFSTRADSFASFGTGPRVVATAGMFVGGAALVLIWWAIRGRTRSIWRSTELRLYVGVIATTAALLAAGSELSVSEAVFTTVSAVSTTGHAVGDWTVLPDAVLMVMLVLIGTGSMAASAGGGLRMIRAWTLVGYALRELRRQLEPHAVVVVKQAGQPIDERTLAGTTGYQIAHLALCGLAGFVLALAGLDLMPAIYTGISVISTHGPGLGTGAYGDLTAFSPAARLALLPFMLAGRLTILPLLLAVSYAFRLEGSLVRGARRQLRRVGRR